MLFVIAEYVESPANLILQTCFPFLVNLILAVATPFLLVFTMYFLPLMVNITFLPLRTLPLLVLSVVVSFLVLALALNVFLELVSLGFCLFTLMLAEADEPKYFLLPSKEIVAL